MAPFTLTLIGCDILFTTLEIFPFLRYSAKERSTEDKDLNIVADEMR